VTRKKERILPEGSIKKKGESRSSKRLSEPLVKTAACMPNARGKKGRGKGWGKGGSRQHLLVN